MTQSEPEFKATSWHMLPPCSNVITIELTCRPAKFQDMMLCPEYNAVMVLSEAEVEYLEEFNAGCEPLVQALHQAQADRQQVYQDNPDPGVTPRALKQQADQAVVTAKANLDAKLKQLVNGGGASGSYWYELHALHGEKRVFFAPGSIVSPTRSRSFYFLTEDNPDATNAFESLKQPDGRIDPEKFKDAFTQTSAKIKAEWDLVDTETTQVSTKVLANAANPIVAALLNDQLDTLDETIAQWNEAMHWQTQQYQGDKEDALKSLKADPFTFEDFGRAQALCEDIWGRRNPMARVQYNTVQGNEGMANRQTLVEAVTHETLPPPRWDASADANLMRFTRGVTLGTDIDLKKGLVSAELKAEMDFALAEGKLRGAVYYPHRDGCQARPSITRTGKKAIWEESPGFIPDAVHLEWDDEFLTFDSVGELAEALMSWDLIRTTLGQDRYRLMVVGHADQSGPDDYNLKLSSRRALVVYGLLTRNVDIWLSFFTMKTATGTPFWGERERQLMKEIAGPNLAFGSDRQLIEEYFNVCDRVFQGRGLRIPRLVPQDFAQAYMLSKERHPYIDNQLPIVSLGENFPVEDRPHERLEANRRVEFQLVELVGEAEYEDKAPIDLGAFRVSLEGHIGGYAGVNISLAANLKFDTAGGIMSLGNADDEGSTSRSNGNASANNNHGQATVSESGAAATADAFIGAKVEAGLRAALDWKAPETDDQITPPEFKAMGTLGYLVSGQAGIGLSGEIKIGWDSEIQRFVIVTKASLCVGLGAGGKLEFTVDAKNVWNFISLVYDQLYKADFSVIDFFDDDVYDRFVAWSYQLMKKGLLLQGLAIRTSLEAASQALEVLELGQQLIRDLTEEEQNSQSLHELISYIEEHPLYVRFAAPEVKGRVLYHLRYSDRHWWRDWELGDVDGKRERAIVTVLTLGVVSKREYKEVLEHTLKQPTSGRTEREKDLHAAKVHEDLLSYMNDDEDRHALFNWWTHLADPSGASPVGWNPFNR